MIFVGAILAMNGSAKPAISAPTASTAAVVEQSSPSTTSPTVTIAPTTTTTAAATTSTVAATTTTAAAAETVLGFVELYAAAITNGDSSFVLSRLHPQVVERFTMDVCQNWVATEIMALSDYEVAGEATGPQDREFSIAGSSVRIDDVYSVPVRFKFGGQSFDSTADFALLNGLIYWLGTCK